MSAVQDALPITDHRTPADQPALQAMLAEAHATDTPVYPIGGGTALGYGHAATTPGWGLTLTQLNRVIDYPSRDMTITVEAGMTLQALGETLAGDHQWLPIDAGQPAQATLGGLVATAWSGPRRYGCGTMRDYVIGIQAVDGRGVPFKAGGRVVKNVAGYDFCKLLTGSLGTLGVISQVTLKVRPRPERSAFVVVDVSDATLAERLLAAIVHSAVTPVAVELLAGPHWRNCELLGPTGTATYARLAVGLEGTADEVDWMVERLISEWRELGASAGRAVLGEAAALLWEQLRDFAEPADSPLVLKASVLPSRVTEWIAAAVAVDTEVSIQSHAGNGIVIARFARFDAGDISQALIGNLQPLARRQGGNTVVLHCGSAGLTRQAVWGSAGAEVAWMTRAKRQFDPKNLLNPGRFVYENC